MLKKKEKEVRREIEKYVYESFEDLELTFWDDLNKELGEVIEKYKN